MFWNLSTIYFFIIFLLTITTYSSSSSPLTSNDHVTPRDPYEFDQTTNKDVLLSSSLVDRLPTSIDEFTSSSSSSSSSPSGPRRLPFMPTSPIDDFTTSSIIPNEEETIRLQFALALQIDAELNKAVELKNAANESIEQANLFNKAASEAEHRAQIAGHMLNSLKQLLRNKNIIDQHSMKMNDEKVMKKRELIKVPIINYDYLLDETIGNRINTDDDRDERRHRTQQSDHHDGERTHHRQKRSNHFMIPELLNKELHMKHLYDYADDNQPIGADDDEATDADVDEDRNIQKLSKTEQLTLEKLRLLILRQLIKQQRQAEYERNEEQSAIPSHHPQPLRHHLRDNDADESQYDHPWIDKPLYDQLQTFRELHRQHTDDDVDDVEGEDGDRDIIYNDDEEDEINNELEKSTHGIKHYLTKKAPYFDGLADEDSIVFK
ncbi:unnamed protein product [Schistosoma turkestanicum]|nr:unnamed protein product [Schistosoma turkestanicum]